MDGAINNQKYVDVENDNSNILSGVHTEAANVYVAVPLPFSILPLFHGTGNLLRERFTLIRHRCPLRTTQNL